MRLPGSVWVWITVGLFLPGLGWAVDVEAKAIFANGKGPIVVEETPDSIVPLRRPSLSPNSKATAAKQTEPQPEQHLGLTYWVELDNGNGRHSRLGTDWLFRRGDRVRLQIMSNWEGRLYVVNLSSTGGSHVATISEPPIELPEKATVRPT